MPFFSYKAVNSSGEIVKGRIEGSDIDLASDSVASSGLYILKMRKLNNFTNFISKNYKAGGVKTKDITEFTNNLAVMLRAGLPLLTSLHDISDSIENKTFGRIIQDIEKMIEHGSSFGMALAHHKDIFPEIVINLVSVGEETGRLDKSLSEISIHVQRMEDLKSAIKKALIYPTFAIVTTGGSVLFWLIYVMPKIVGLFETLTVELPLLTRILIASSNFSRAHWYIFFLIPVVIFSLFKILSNFETTKYYIDSAKLRIPIIKPIVFNKLLALFTEQFRILFSAGLRIERCFDVMIKVINNSVYKKALVSIREDILHGSRIHEALKKHNTLFPNLVTSLIFVGQESGNLPEQLNYLSEEFIKRLNDVSQKIEKMIEPLVIVSVGLLFMVIIVGLLFPIYDLISTVGTG